MTSNSKLTMYVYIFPHICVYLSVVVCVVFTRAKMCCRVPYLRRGLCVSLRVESCCVFTRVSCVVRPSSHTIHDGPTSTLVNDPSPPLPAYRVSLCPPPHRRGPYRIYRTWSITRVPRGTRFRRAYSLAPVKRLEGTVPS